MRETELQSSGKSESLQALRGIAFLGIFLIHAGSSIEWSRLGVSIFLVMSGFLLMRKSMEHPIDCSVSGNFRYMLRKIKKLFPLHLLTMLFALLLQLAVLIVNAKGRDAWLELMGGVITNIFLVQSWIPAFTISLNSVAWYLSVMCFLYFLFPWLSRGLRKRTGKGRRKWLVLFAALLLVAQVLFAIGMELCFGKESGIYHWATYTFPVFRLGDFCIGCFLGVLTKREEKADISQGKATLLEILVLVYTLLLYLWIRSEHSSIFTTALANETTLWVLAAVGFVWMFFSRQGLISRGLSNPFFIFLGDLSATAYLIHNIVTGYINNGLEFLGFSPQGALFWLKAAVEFGLTIVLSLSYQRLAQRIRDRK